MKPYFTEPITDIDQAYAFFYKLWADGLLFHPEDDPRSIWNSRDGGYLFNDAEVEVLRQRIMETYQLDFDPCAYCLGLSGSYEGVDDRNKPAS